jgi:hypothetical protein
LSLTTPGLLDKLPHFQGPLESQFKFPKISRMRFAQQMRLADWSVTKILTSKTREEIFVIESRHLHRFVGHVLGLTERKTEKPNPLAQTTLQISLSPDYLLLEDPSVMGTTIKVRTSMTAYFHSVSAEMKNLLPAQGGEMVLAPGLIVGKFCLGFNDVRADKQ